MNHNYLRQRAAAGGGVREEEEGGEGEGCYVYRNGSPRDGAEVQKVLIDIIPLHYFSNCITFIDC